MVKRVGLSKATRFRIFDRDGFTCRYCGKSPPVVLLVIDHVIAVANGGTNDEENLITACADCNSGKGAKALTKGLNPSDERRRAQELLETINMARLFKDAVAAAKALKMEIAAYLCEATGQGAADQRTLSFLAGYAGLFGPREILGWIDSAVSALGLGLPAPRYAIYMSGIAKRRRGEIELQAAASENT